MNRILLFEHVSFLKNRTYATKNQYHPLSVKRAFQRGSGSGDRKSGKSRSQNRKTTSRRFLGRLFRGSGRLLLGSRLESRFLSGAKIGKLKGSGSMRFLKIIIYSCFIFLYGIQFNLFATKLNTSIPSYAGDFESDSVVQDPYSQYGTPTNPNVSASVMMELIWVVAKLFERPYAALVGDKYGYIDKTGKFIIPSQFDNAHSFSEGLAAVQICEEGSDNGCWKWKYGYIDKTGNFVIPPQFYNADSFSEGLAAIDFCETGPEHECRYGYIDKTGNFVIQPQFKNAYSFSEGLASVQIGEKWGIVNKKGDIVIRPRFEDAIFFSEGLASVQTGKTWEWKNGYMDKTENIVIPSQFDNAHSFSEGLAAVKIGEQWGYINRLGKLVIQPKFDYVYSFSKGLARVSIHGGNMGL